MCVVIAIISTAIHDTHTPVYSAGDVGDPLAETLKIILGSEQAAPSSARRGDAREGAVVGSEASAASARSQVGLDSRSLLVKRGFVGHACVRAM